MDNATSLSLARIGFGSAAWAMPRLGLKAALLDASHPQAPLLVRLFGARDLALGAVTLLAEHRPMLLKVGIAVDASDAVAGLIAWRTGAVGPVAGLALAGAAVAAVATGAAALGQEG